MRIGRSSIRPGSGCVTGCLVRLMIVLIVMGLTGLIAAGVILARRDLIEINLVPRRVVSGPVVMLPAEPDQPPDLLVLTSEEGKSNYTLSYLDAAGQDIRWNGPPLGQAGPQAQVARGDGLAYVAGPQPELIALHLDDGARAWAAELADVIAPQCRDCLRVIEGSVIALAGDTLHAFDALTGEPRWQRALNMTPNALLLFDDRLAVLDRHTLGGILALNLYHPANGALLRRITPRCESGGAMEALSPGSPILYDPASASIYFLFGYAAQGCAQRWDLHTGTLTWETRIDPQDGVWSQAWYDNRPLLAGDTIYFAGDQPGLLAALDTRSGQFRHLVEIPGYRFQPLAVEGDILIVRVVRLDGTGQDELWGLDRRTGKSRWRYVLSGSTDSWAAHPTPGGFMTVQVLPAPDRILVDLLNPANGHRLRRTATPVSSAYWSGTVWSVDTAWVTIGDLYAIDLTSGEAVLVWPKS